MKFSSPAILLTAFVVQLISSSPTGQSDEKRQLNGFFGSLAGLVGVSATYDYVIVGGGTAGLTMASRLSEKRGISVAVIEAGTLYQVHNTTNPQLPSSELTYFSRSRIPYSAPRLREMCSGADQTQQIPILPLTGTSLQPLKLEQPTERYTMPEESVLADHQRETS